MKPRGLGSQSGQLIVEAVLIIVLLMGMTMLAANYFKNDELVKKLVQGPWKSLAGMLQNGSWGSVEATSQNHPNGHGRHIVITGVNPQ